MARKQFLSLVLLLAFSLSGAAEAHDFTPTRKGNGEGWRIGYLEGGPYPHYAFVLRALVVNGVAPIKPDTPVKT